MIRWNYPFFYAEAFLIPIDAFLNLYGSFMREWNAARYCSSKIFTTQLAFNLQGSLVNVDGARYDIYKG